MGGLGGSPPKLSGRATAVCSAYGEGGGRVGAKRRGPRGETPPKKDLCIRPPGARWALCAHSPARRPCQRGWVGGGLHTNSPRRLAAKRYGFWTAPPPYGVLWGLGWRAFLGGDWPRRAQISLVYPGASRVFPPRLPHFFPPFFCCFWTMRLGLREGSADEWKREGPLDGRARVGAPAGQSAGGTIDRVSCVRHGRTTACVGHGGIRRRDR